MWNLFFIAILVLSFWEKSLILKLTFFSILCIPYFVKINLSIGSYSAMTLLGFVSLLFILYVCFFEKVELTNIEKQLAICFSLFFFMPKLLVMPFASVQSISSQFILLKDYVIEFLILAVLWFSLRKNAQTQSVSNFLYIVIFLVCIYGVFVYISNTNPYILGMSALSDSSRSDVVMKYMEEDRGGLTGRVSSTMDHPIKYGAVLVLSFFILLQNLLRTKCTFLFMSKSIVLILVAFNIFISGSRGCLVALILTSFFFFLLCVNLKSKLKIVLCGTMLFFLLFSFPSIQSYRKYIDSIVFFWDDNASDGEVKGSSVEMRINQFIGTIEMINQNGFFFGKGNGYVSNYLAKNGNHPVVLGFESVLFYGLVDYGLVGFFFVYILWYISLLYLFGKSYKALKFKNKVDYYLVLLYLMAYFIILILVNDCARFMFLLGYVFLLRSIQNEEKEKEKFVELLWLFGKKINKT